MNKLPLLTLIAVLASAAPAAAQLSRGDMLDAWGEARVAQAEAHAALAEARAARDKTALRPSPSVIAAQKLGEALQRLRARGGVGASLLKDMGPTVTVAPGQAQPCAIAVSGGGISCSDSLANADVSEAALRLAERAAELRLAKMPDTAEKDYMIISLAARSWIEAGGQVMSEPVMRARMSPWWSRSMSGQGSAADYAPAGATRKSSLDELLAANTKSQAPLQAKIDADQKSFDRANCESEEQGWLNSINESKAALKRLQDEAAALQAWKKALNSFTGEEKAWLTAWTPT